MKKYNITIIRPGGNDTCLVGGIEQNIDTRKRINDAIMKKYPNVEQVGFINTDPKKVELFMAGGEFCGNATRSTAWLALGGRPGELQMKVSGAKQKLKAGVTSSGEAFAQMPIYPAVSKISKDGDNRIVELEGITQYINFNTKEIKGRSPGEIKKNTMAFIRAKNLDRFPAAGITYCLAERGGWRIAPIVYVRAIDTLFMETACGSGTTALGLVLAQKLGSSINTIPIMQPSLLPINVSIVYDRKSFIYAQISGPIELLERNTLVLE